MQVPSNASDFYVYEHTRISDGSIFYVGKGRGNRSSISSKYHRNIFWQNIVNKDGGFNIKHIAEGMDEELAFLIEIERIDQLKKLGIRLCNLTNGGDGLSGLVFTKEHRRKIGMAHKGKTLSQEVKDKISISVKKSGFILTEEMRKKISETHIGHKRNIGRVHSEEEKVKRAKALIGNKSRTGQIRSEEERKKASISLSGRVQGKQVCPHCKKIGGNAMKRWHFDNCKERDS